MTAMDIPQEQETQTTHYEPLRKQRQPDKKMQPPMTPMIDVTFQLLLFFLLTFTFREAEGQIRGSLPKRGSGGVAAKETLTQPIRIHILPTGRARDGASYEVEGVHERIEDADTLFSHMIKRRDAVNSTEIPVIIKPDAFVRWNFVVEVFNQALRLKFENIGFAPAS